MLGISCQRGKAEIQEEEKRGQGEEETAMLRQGVEKPAMPRQGVEEWRRKLGAGLSGAAGRRQRATTTVEGATPENEAVRL